MKLIQKKICLLGDFAVGKTSLVRRYVEGRFDDKYLSTIGVKISNRQLNRENYQLNLIIWDLAGGETFSGYDKNYLRGAAGALLVFDLTRLDTLRILSDYVNQMCEINPDASMMVAAHKFDLVHQNIPDTSELESFCQNINGQYLFTSAKTGENVDEIINLLADHIMAEE